MKLDQLVEALGARASPTPPRWTAAATCCSRAGEEEAAQAMCRSKLRDIGRRRGGRADAGLPLMHDAVRQHAVAAAAGGRADLHLPVLYYPELLGLALGLDAGGVGSGPAPGGRGALPGEVGRRGGSGSTRCASTGTTSWCGRARSAARASNDCPVARADSELRSRTRWCGTLAAGEIEEVLRLAGPVEVRGVLHLRGAVPQQVRSDDDPAGSEAPGDGAGSGAVGGDGGDEGLPRDRAADGGFGRAAPAAGAAAGGRRRRRRS